MLVLWTLEDSGEERNHKLPKAPGTFGTLNGRPGTGPMKLFTFTVPVLYRNGMHFVDDTGPPSSVSPQVFANAGTLVGQTLPHGVSFNISSSHLSVRSRQQQQQQYEHRAAAPHGGRTRESWRAQRKERSRLSRPGQARPGRDDTP